MARNPRNHHVLPLWCDDLVASTCDMTPACFGAYVRLLCYAWSRGGIPNCDAICDRIAGGIGSQDLSQIRARMVVLDEGTPDERLSHPRLELEREAVEKLRQKRSSAGKKGNSARWSGQSTGGDIANGSQADRKFIAKRSPGDRKTIAPTPTPNPTPIDTDNTTRAGDPDRDTYGPEAGWALREWERFASAWERTERAKPWAPLQPPDGWVDYAASPGWLGKAHDALARLPGCQWFDQPVAITRFFVYVDRILAGEFDSPKHDGGLSAGRRRQPMGGNL